jgi:hypothetical protein
VYDSCAKKDTVKDSWAASSRIAGTVTASNNGSVGRKCKTKSEPHSLCKKSIFAGQFSSFFSFSLEVMNDRPWLIGNMFLAYWCVRLGI